MGIFMKRLVTAQQKSNYSIQILDDASLSNEEREFGVISFTIRVQGQPLNPEIIIPQILPQIQRYIKTKYSQYQIDNITYDNFNPAEAHINDKFPDTIDFKFTTNFS
jgi:hypothetical protein